MAGQRRVRDRQVLITGATSGIGAGLAREFHAHGATVHLVARSRADLAALVAELGPRATAMPTDLSHPDACRLLADRLAEVTDHLDVLVNNAGTTWGAPLTAYPDAAWDKVLALNLVAPFRLTVACLSLLRAAANVDDPARVIMIGSVDGITVPPWESYAYSSSKAGLHHLTRHLARRLAETPVTVNAIAPGVVPSRMTGPVLETRHDELVAATPLGRLGRPEDVAAAAVFLASSGAAWITGAVLPVDGGYATLR